jgi:prepilin-type N-terminal cleavage/methylation domain-containing protein/prepilin-type processing-associated H-X9-DG protein
LKTGTMENIRWPKALKGLVEISSVSKCAKKGFTLIELLVVIAIIALLLSILTPALNKVKEQAKTLVCRTNTKQLNMALMLYSNEYNNKGLNSEGGVDYWPMQIAPYFGDNVYKDDPEKMKEGVMAILYCPSTKEPLIETGGSWGTAKNQWRYHVVGSEGSYCLNTWIGGWDFDEQIFYNIIKKKDILANSFRDSVPGRADIGVIADGIWLDFVTMNNYGYDPENIDPEIGGFDNGLGRIHIDRHNKGINVSFADSHAELVKLKDIWKLRWSKTYKPENPFPDTTNP